MSTELHEHEAKALLRQHGLSVPRGALVKTRDEAAKLGASLAKPLAMKAIAPGVVHKSAAGLVRLNVAPGDAARVFDELQAAAPRGGALTGILVEEMAPPGLEIVIGVSTSPGFGPTIMFGAGGLDVEQRRDVSFRLVPVTAADAREMLAETAIGAQCKDFAGVIDAIVAIGGKDGLVLTAGIDELDINPLRVGPNGIVALDAYARTGTREAREQNAARGDLYASLQPLFMPQSIVVVGASSRPGKMGFEVIKCLVDYGYRGKLYGVNPSANNIYGCRVFPTVAALPERVERAIVVVPAAEVPQALADCAAKGVRVAHVYSAGFSEWRDEGQALERAVRKVVADTGLRVVGPNSNGAFSASGRMTKSPVRYSPAGPGKISFISQSGTYTSDVIARSAVLGLPLEHSLSCGNCIDLDPTDYLQYCAGDPKIEIIAMYLETVPDAGRFFRLAREIGKPVVVMKGGRTAEGNRVATTHTGALASDELVWAAAARQSGVVMVEGMRDLMDVLLGFSAFGTIGGPGLALFTSGGGISVTATDVAVSCGLRMPALRPETVAALSHHASPGTSVANPVDLPVWGLRTDAGYVFDQMIDTLSADPQVSSVIVTAEMGSIFNYTRDEADGIGQMREIVKSAARRRDARGKVSLVLRSTGDKIQDDFVREVRPGLLAQGIAVYDDVLRAVKAHAKLFELGRPRAG